MSPVTSKLDLNLLPSQAKFQAVLMRMKGLAKRTTTILIIVWLSVVLIVSILWLGGRWWLESAKANYQKELNSFLSMSEVTVTSQIVKFRAKLLGKILADRFEYYGAFSKVSKLFAEEVTVKDFTLKDMTKFKLTLLVGRGELLDGVEKRIEEINKGLVAGIKGAKILEVSYSRAGREWTVNLEVELIK
jgi:hypothetical protein